MYCINCGKENDDDSLYCKYCGKKLVSVTNENIPPENVSQEKELNVKQNFDVQYLLRNWIIGFRTNKTWKKVTACIYYGLSLLISYKTLYMFPVLLSIPYMAFGVCGFFYRHDNKRLFFALIGFILFMIGGFLSVGATNDSNNKNDKNNIVATATSTPTLAPTTIATAVPTPEPTEIDLQKSYDEMRESWDGAKQSLKEAKDAVVDSYYEASGQKRPTPKPSEYEQMLEDYIAIDYQQLWQEYQDNPIQADANYKGKNLMISGRVDNIDREILGQPYINFEIDYLAGIRVTFDKSEEEKVAALNNGDIITVVGECRGALLSTTVSLGNCYIVQ